MPKIMGKGLDKVPAFEDREVGLVIPRGWQCLQGKSHQEMTR